MTRLNLVPPSELMDQHLFAEFREIKMVPKSLARSIAAERKRNGHQGALYTLWQRIPKQYTLNTGHVSFFYDKGAYLRRRYDELKLELLCRAVIDFNQDSPLDPDGVFASLDHNFNNDYVPTSDALAIIRERIEEKIALRPNWYRMYGKVQQ